MTELLLLACFSSICLCICSFFICWNNSSFLSPRESAIFFRNLPGSFCCCTPSCSYCRFSLASSICCCSIAVLMYLRTAYWRSTLVVYWLLLNSLESAPIGSPFGEITLVLALMLGSCTPFVVMRVILFIYGLRSSVTG